MHFSTKSLVLLALSVISVAGSPITFAGKRGILFDWLSHDYSKFFVGSQKVTFGSDWHATRGETGATLEGVFKFISTLIVDKDLRNDKWLSTVGPLIDSGEVKTVFAYVARETISSLLRTSSVNANTCPSSNRSNEPDNAGQANLSPQNAAKVYKQYMMPLKGRGAGLATPAVTNGGGTAGLNYLETFLTFCQDCTFDLINVHHYVPRSDCTVDVAVAALKNYIDKEIPAVQAKHPQLQGIPICLGEVCTQPFGILVCIAKKTVANPNFFFPVNSSGF